MNTTTSLRQVLTAEVNALNGMAISQKSLIEKVTTKYPQFSKGYVQMYVRKCTVNNPYRAKFGKAVDLFAKTSNGFLVSSQKHLTNFDYVTEDVEYVKTRKTARQVAMTEILDAYMNGANFAL
jgi:hypothetical protein